MKFLVDAQLPVRLALLLNNAGREAVHTSDLPDGNASTDAQVVGIADAQDRVVVTKDRDFPRWPSPQGFAEEAAHRGHGNISALLKLFEVHLGAATSALDDADFVELWDPGSPDVGW